MKKLLTLLLTLVMAVCLVNLNNSHTKANEDDITSINYSITLNSDGTKLVKGDTSDQVPTDIATYDSSTNTITVSKSLSLEKNDSPLFNIKKDVTFKIEGEVTLQSAYTLSRVIEVTNNVSITIEGDGTNTLTMVANQAVIQGALNQLTINDITVDVTSQNNIPIGPKSLTLNSNAKLKAKTGIDTGSNFSAFHVYSTTPPTVLRARGKRGTGDMVVLTTSNWKKANKYGAYCYFVDATNKTTYVELNYEEDPTPIPEPEQGDMAFDENKVVEAGTTGAFVDTVQKGNDSKTMHVLHIATNESNTKVSKKDEDTSTWNQLSKTDNLYTIATGVATGGDKFTKLTFNKGYIKDLPVGIHYFKVELDDSPSNKTKTFYIEITITEAPQPTPSPSKKDESCEKVIGPTWHWNNSKGICEDYGVVGTYTR